MPAPSERLRAYPLAPPIGGINARDSLFQMAPTDAVSMNGWVPEGPSLRAFHSGRSVSPPATPYVTVATPGTSGEHITASSTSDMFTFDATGFYVEAAAGVDKSGATTLTNPYWEWVQFNQIVFAVNGTDAPVEWTGGTNVLTNTAWTGPTLTNLNSIASYEGRLYFGDKTGTKYHYANASGVGSGTGALTEVDLQSFSRLGGNICGLGPASIGTTDTQDNVFIIYTVAGEVFAFSGDHPNASNWRSIGRYEIAPPIESGVRSFTYVAGDLWITTIAGPVSVRSLLSGGQYLVSDKINNLWRQLQLENAGEEWRAVYYPERDYVLWFIGDKQPKAIGFRRPNQAWFEVSSLYFLGASVPYYSRIDKTVWYSDDSARYFMDHPVYVGGHTDPTFQQAFSALSNQVLVKSLSQVQPFFEEKVIVGSDYPSPNATQKFDIGVYEDFSTTLSSEGSAEILLDETAKVSTSPVDVIGEGQFLSLNIELGFTGSSPKADLRYNGAILYTTEGGTR